MKTLTSLHTYTPHLVCHLTSTCKFKPTQLFILTFVTQSPVLPAELIQEAQGKKKKEQAETILTQTSLQFEHVK